MERYASQTNKVEYKVQEFYRYANGRELTMEWRATIWSEHGEKSSVSGEVALAFDVRDLGGPDEITRGCSPVEFPSRVLEQMALQAEHDKDALVRQMEESVEE